MCVSEQEQWRQLNPAGMFYTFNPLDADDVQSGFDNLFQQFARNGALSTMLISADPFFQKYKDELIRAANGINKTVCYPLHAYKNNEGIQPTPGRHFLHGPKLARACFFLGRDVADVRLNDAAPGFRVPPMLIDANDDVS
jgi:hypothetical protein